MAAVKKTNKASVAPVGAQNINDIISARWWRLYLQYYIFDQFEVEALCPSLVMSMVALLRQEPKCHYEENQ